MLVAAGLLLTAMPVLRAQNLYMVPLGTVNLDSTSNAANPEFIGSNPSVVAWNGSELWVGGWNGGAPGSNIGIVQVSDPLGSPTYGTPFGVIAAPSSRGYTGLDISGNNIAAAYDPGGSDPQGIALYATTGAQLWTKSARGGSGVGFDPGFRGGNPALGSGVGWTTFGSGRRALQDTATGADIWTTGDGMIFTPGGGSFHRDMDFDDATGDIFVRRANDLIYAQRTGDNSATGQTLLFDTSENGPFVALQTAAFMGCDIRAVIFNDRSSTATGQAFSSVIKAVDLSGNSLSIDWGSFTASNGNGAYDFSFDATTGTLALLDYANRDCHLFRVLTSPPPCEAFNDADENVSTSTTPSPFTNFLPGYRAYQFTASATQVLEAGSIFTARSMSLSSARYIRVEIWQDDGAGAPDNATGALGSGTIYAEPGPAKWLGANFDVPVPVTQGSSYWFVMVEAGGMVVPEDPMGPTLLTRRTATNTLTWGALGQGAAKIRMYCNKLHGWCTDPDGDGCTTSLGGKPQLYSNVDSTAGNTSFYIEGSGMPGGEQAFLTIGFDPTFPDIDLGMLGWPTGCTLYNTAEFAVGLGMTGIADIGTTALPFGYARAPIPLLNTVAGFSFEAQFVCFDLANAAPLKAVFSNGLKITIP